MTNKEKHKDFLYSIVEMQPIMQPMTEVFYISYKLGIPICTFEHVLEALKERRLRYEK